MHEETAQIIMHLEDILSLSLWTNRRDKYRNIGNKFDSKFIPAVGGLSFLTLSATIGTTIFSSINETVGTIGGIGSGLAGLFAFTRLPNILYGNGRFHAHSRGRKLAKDVYAMTKMYDRKVRVERLIEQLKKSGKSFTPAEWEHINSVISNIKSTIKTMTNRQKNRKEISTYNTFYQEIQSKRDSEIALRKISRKMARKRSKLWDKVKYPDLLARSAASKEVEKLMGPAWEQLSWLIDPKKTKESITENTEIDKNKDTTSPERITVNHGGYTFENTKHGLLIPGTQSHFKDESSSHEKVYRGEWDPDVIEGIKKDFDYLDFSRFIGIFDDLLTALQKLAPKTKQKILPPPRFSWSNIFTRGSQQHYSKDIL